eukprot:1385317-Amorphochlora_amoeboformis.AAC.1
MKYTHEDLPTLSNEEIEKLAKIRPATLGDAAKIQGITPASLLNLYRHITGRGVSRADTAKMESAVAVLGSRVDVDGGPGTEISSN